MKLLIGPGKVYNYFLRGTSILLREQFNIFKIFFQVKGLESLLSEKENERRILLGQYEQLSRDLHKVETINRNLEMQVKDQRLRLL